MSNKVGKMVTYQRKSIHSSRRRKFIMRTFFVGAFLIGLYLLVYPLIPKLLFTFVYKNREVYPYKTDLIENVPQEKTIFGEKEIPEENRIVIPAINVDMPIVEGNSEKMLNLGVWHRPATGHPGVGNMVLTGHRVGYAFLPDDVKNSTSFYNLDKLKEDDFVIIYWEGKEYDYQVYFHEIVEPDAFQIESQEGDERLTLYTCDPIGKNAKRLVYYAHPFQVNKD